MKKGCWFCISLLLLTLFTLFSSCEDYPNGFLHLGKDTEAEINYIVYMAADNDLEPYAIENLYDLKKVGSSDKVNFIVLLDTASSDKTKLLYITNEGSLNHDAILDTEYPMDERDMTDSSVLYHNFLKLICDNYPSKRTILNIWSHGYGTHRDGAVPGLSQKSVIEDVSSQKTMKIVDFANALKQFYKYTGRKIDILQWDACDMQMLEVAYEIKDYVNYIVGAETEIANTGSDYEDIASHLVSNPQESTFSIAKYLVNSFDRYYRQKGEAYSYGIVDANALDKFMVSFNAIVDEALKNEPLPQGQKLLEKFVSYRSAESIFMITVETRREFCDLYALLEWFDEQLKSLDNEAAQRTINWRDEFDKLVPYYKQRGFNLTRSLGINMPYTAAQLKEYKRPSTATDQRVLSIYSDTHLPELIKALEVYAK